MTCASTVAGTTADDSVTLAFAVRVIEGADEGAKALLADEVAMLTKSIACTVAADVIDTEITLALVITTAGHTICLEGLALAERVTLSGPVSVLTVSPVGLSHAPTWL